MEGVENSPIVLAFAQLVVLILNVFLYSRQKSAVDVEKRDRGAFGNSVAQALQLATSADRRVETIELDHYRKLSTMFAAQATELEEAKARIRSLEETVSSLSNKLASRDRADRSAAKRAEKESEPEMPAEPGSADVDELVRLGHAIPLAPQLPAPAARPNSFGKSAR